MEHDTQRSTELLYQQSFMMTPHCFAYQHIYLESGHEKR